MELNKQLDLQSLLQTIGLVGGLIYFAISSEHRVTVIEATLQTQGQFIQELSSQLSTGTGKSKTHD